MILVSKNMEFIRLTISQPFLKIKTSGLDQKNSLKLCAEHFIFGVIRCLFGHMAWHFFLKESANNIATVSSRLPQQTVLLDCKQTLDL